MGLVPPKWNGPPRKRPVFRTLAQRLQDAKESVAAARHLAPEVALLLAVAETELDDAIALVQIGREEQSAREQTWQLDDVVGLGPATPGVP